MTDTQDPMDWVKDHCTPFVDLDGQTDTDHWVWPSGMVHSQPSSVAMVRMHRALDREPTDLITAEFMGAVVDRLLRLEERVRQSTEEPSITWNGP